MTVKYADYVQVAWRRRVEWQQVQAVAQALRHHLDSPKSAAAILTANQPGRSSADIQNTLGARARELGFQSEKTGLFSDSDLSLRPDYYMPMGSTGILLEVERGKTTINNMDLLDFWKCHVCRHANYLFLLVPTELRQNERMSPRREFAAVSRRLAPLFISGNETNVRGVCLFGY